MKRWIGLVAVVVLSLSTGVVVRAGEQEDKSSHEIQGKRVTGQLIHIEGWHYTIKDSTGEEVSFGVTSVTKDPDQVKEGDQIIAMIGDDRIALSLKNMKKKK
ncbi:MAG TPA: hypothetical protein VD738_03120 [Nitrospira sp.]|nr:hypothetical protein [Nitrospira sp.]